MNKINVLLLFLMLGTGGTISAQSDVRYICFTDSSVVGYPLQLTKDFSTNDEQVVVTLANDSVVSFDAALVDTVTTVNPAARFTSFKFNNKFNSGLPEDVFFDISEFDLTATAGGIGKYMTPSFQTDREAVVKVDTVIQKSKVSHLNFTGDVTYTVTDERCRILAYKTGRYSMVPNTYTYNVHTDWLVDNAKVPRIDINIDGGKKVTSKTVYLHAKIIVDGGGMYDSFEDSVYVRGRGNSTWGGANALKNPYRLKFNEKVSFFGLKSGKSWVLLANRMDPTLMTNSVAMRVAQMVKSAYANHAVPVELYMNGSYYGSYVLTEQVGINNNSVDQPDNCVLLELDTNFDEDFKFVSDIYKIPVMIKNPDNIVLPSEASARRDGKSRLPIIKLTDIQTDFNRMEQSVSEGNAGDYLNIDSFARYMFVYDFAHNMELNHPKSVYVYKPYSAQKYIFGPIWDFDWAYGYELGYYYSYYDVPVIYPKFSGGKNGYKDGSGYRFCLEVMTQEATMKAYYRLWRSFMQNDGLQEILDYIDLYAKFSDSSFKHNEEEYLGNWSYSYYLESMRAWIPNRVEYIYSNLKAFADDPVIPDGIEDVEVTVPDGKREGVKLTVVNRALQIESPRELMLPVYDASGKRVAMIQVHEGLNLYVIIPRGLLIIDGQKVYLP